MNVGIGIAIVYLLVGAVSFSIFLLTSCAVIRTADTLEKIEQHMAVMAAESEVAP